MVVGGDAGRTPRLAVMGELAAREGAAAGVRPARAVPSGACAGARAELGDTRRLRRPIVPAAVVAGGAEALGARRPREAGAAQAAAAVSIRVQSVLGAGCIAVPAAGLEGAGTGRPLRLVGSAAHAAVRGVPTNALRAGAGAALHLHAELTAVHRLANDWRCAWKDRRQAGGYNFEIIFR